MHDLRASLSLSFSTIGRMKCLPCPHHLRVHISDEIMSTKSLHMKMTRNTPQKQQQQQHGGVICPKLATQPEEPEVIKEERLY